MKSHVSDHSELEINQINYYLNGICYKVTLNQFSLANMAYKKLISMAIW
jgi:hypothetical protein